MTEHEQSFSANQEAELAEGACVHRNFDSNEIGVSIYPAPVSEDEMREFIAVIQDDIKSKHVSLTDQHPGMLPELFLTFNNEASQKHASPLQNRCLPGEKRLR